MQLADLRVTVDDSDVDRAHGAINRLLDKLKGLIGALNSSEGASKKTNQELKRTAEEADKASKKTRDLNGALDSLSGMGGPLGDLANRMRGFREQAESAGGAIRALGVAGGGLGVAGGAVLALAGGLGMLAAFNAAPIINEFRNLGEKFGVSTTQAMILSKALDGIDASLEDLANAQNKVGVAMANASKIGSDQEKVFRSLGITFGENATKEEVALKIAQQYTKAREEGALSTEKLSQFQSILGEEVDKSTQWILAGAEAQEKLNRYQSLGLGISKESEEASKTFKSAVSGLGDTMIFFGASLAQDVLPYFSRLITAFNDSYQSGGIVRGVFDGIRIAIIPLNLVLVTLGESFRTVFTIAEIVGKGIGGIFAGIAAAIRGDFSQAASIFNDTFVDSLETAKERLQGFGKAFKEAGSNALTSVGQVMDRSVGSVGNSKPRSAGGSGIGSKARESSNSNESARIREEANAIQGYANVFINLSNSVGEANFALSNIRDTFAAVSAGGSFEGVQGYNSYFSKLLKASGDARKAAENLAEAKKMSAGDKEQFANQAGLAAFLEAQGVEDTRNYTKFLTEASKLLSDQTRQGILAKSVDAERLRLVLEMEDSLKLILNSHASLSAEQRKELQAARDGVLAAYDKNRALKVQEDQQRRLNNIIAEGQKVRETLQKSFGIGPGMYGTTQEKEYQSLRDNTFAPFLKALDELKTRREEQIRRMAEVKALVASGQTVYEGELVGIVNNVDSLGAEQDKLGQELLRTKNELESAIYQHRVLSNSFVHGFKTGITEILSSMPTIAGATSSMMQTVSQTMESSLLNTMKTGKFAVKDFFKSLLEELAKITIRLMIIKPLMQGLTGAVGAPAVSSGVGAGVGSGVDYSLAGIGGRFSSGGIVGGLTAFQTANGTATMSENNPEAILPLRRNTRGDLGVVISESASKSSAVVNVGTISVVVQGAQTNAETGRTVSDAIVNQLRQVARSEIAAGLAPGGMIRSSMR